MVNEVGHLVHGADDGLRAGSLFLDGGTDLLGDFREAVGGLGDLRGADRLFVGGRADLLGEFVDFGDDVGNFVEGAAKIVAEAEALFDDAGAVLHVFDGLARFTLDALNQVGDFLGGLRGLFGQLADFVGDDSKAEAVFTGARGFNGSVQRKQVGLFREVINDFDDLANVVGAMAENVDDFRRRLNGAVGAVQAIGGLLHGLNTGDHFLARAVGDVEKKLGGVGDALNRSDHLILGRGRFPTAGSTYLWVLYHVLHVQAHFGHGAGGFVVV